MVTKTIIVDGKEVKLKASAAIPRLYRAKFGRDIFRDLSKIDQSVTKKEENDDGIPIMDLEMFENISFLMAKHADSSIGGIDEWLEQFNIFSIYEVLPEILSLWNLNLRSEVESKKN